MEAEERLRVPAVIRDAVPPANHDLFRWAQIHVRKVARRYAVSLDDLWDEALTALLRASVYYKEERAASENRPGKSTPFGRYAITAIHRACWRHGVRGSIGKPDRIPLETAELVTQSPEVVVLAAETARNRISTGEVEHGIPRRIQAGS